MADLVTTAVEALTKFLSGIGNGITSLFTSLLYQTNGSEKVLSDFAIYTMVLLGISLAITIIFKVVSMIRHRG